MILLLLSSGVHFSAPNPISEVLDHALTIFEPDLNADGLLHLLVGDWITGQFYEGLMIL